MLVNGPQTPLATTLKPAEIEPHVPEIPLGKCLLDKTACLCTAFWVVFKPGTLLDYFFIHIHFCPNFYFKCVLVRSIILFINLVNLFN